MILRAVSGMVFNDKNKFFVVARTQVYKFLALFVDGLPAPDGSPLPR